MDLTDDTSNNSAVRRGHPADKGENNNQNDGNPQRKFEEFAFSGVSPVERCGKTTVVGCCVIYYSYYLSLYYKQGCLVMGESAPQMRNLSLAALGASNQASIR
jgi:hypothetical protein